MTPSPKEPRTLPDKKWRNTLMPTKKLADLFGVSAHDVRNWQRGSTFHDIHRISHPTKGRTSLWWWGDADADMSLQLKEFESKPQPSRRPRMEDRVKQLERELERERTAHRATREGADLLERSNTQLMLYKKQVEEVVKLLNEGAEEPFLSLSLHEKITWMVQSSECETSALEEAQDAACMLKQENLALNKRLEELAQKHVSTIGMLEAKHAEELERLKPRQDESLIRRTPQLTDEAVFQEMERARNLTTLKVRVLAIERLGEDVPLEFKKLVFDLYSEIERQIEQETFERLITHYEQVLRAS